MGRDDPTRVAEMYAEAARANYERDGYLAPVIALHGRRRLIVKMGPTDRLAEAFGEVVYRFAPIVRPDVVVTVAETWQRSAEDTPEGRERVEGIRRGDLERDAKAGDTSVKTALMVTAWVRDDDEAVVTILQTDTTRAGMLHDVLQPKAYDRMVVNGRQEGNMSDCVLGAWRQGLEDLSIAVPESLLDDVIQMVVTRLGAHRIIDHVMEVG